MNPAHTYRKTTPLVVAMLSAILAVSGGCASINRHIKEYRAASANKRLECLTQAVPPPCYTVNPCFYGYNPTCWQYWPAGWDPCGEYWGNAGDMGSAEDKLSDGTGEPQEHRLMDDFAPPSPEPPVAETPATDAVPMP